MIESLFKGRFRFKRQLRFKRPSRKCGDCFGANRCEEMIRKKVGNTNELDHGSFILKSIGKIQTSCQPRNNQEESERQKGTMEVVAFGKRVNNDGKLESTEVVIFANETIYNCERLSIANEF